VRWISAALAIFLLIFAVEARALACGVTMISLNFGVYDTRSASPVDSDGYVSVNCPPNVSYLIRFDAGGNSGGSFLPRKLRLSGSTGALGYNLYRDSARTEIWGDGTNKTYILSGVGNGLQQTLIVYGRIPGSQNVVPGSYTDAITVTIEW